MSDTELPVTSVGEGSVEQMLAACLPDLEGLALTPQEQRELIGAIRCIVETLLDTKYQPHER